MGTAVACAPRVIPTPFLTRSGTRSGSALAMAGPSQSTPAVAATESWNPGAYRRAPGRPGAARPPPGGAPGDHRGPVRWPRRAAPAPADHPGPEHARLPAGHDDQHDHQDDPDHDQGLAAGSPDPGQPEPGGKHPARLAPLTAMGGSARPPGSRAPAHQRAARCRRGPCRRAAQHFRVQALQGTAPRRVPHPFADPQGRAARRRPLLDDRIHHHPRGGSVAAQSLDRALPTDARTRSRSPTASRPVGNRECRRVRGCGRCWCHGGPGRR